MLSLEMVAMVVTRQLLLTEVTLSEDQAAEGGSDLAEEVEMPTFCLMARRWRITLAPKRLVNFR